MVEYIKKSSGINGLGLAGTLTGAAALLGVMSGGGSIPGILGGPQRFAADQVASQGGYITKDVLAITQESAGKDAVIAQLRAEKYADAAIKAEVEPVKTRVCALETAVAVNAARDHDYRRYVEREFVHQPKASIRESIVVCKQCGCDCCCPATPDAPAAG